MDRTPETGGAAAAPAELPRITLSIVSHGQARLIAPLLADLERLQLPGIEVLLTINIPEDESPLAGRSTQAVVIRNEHPQGFGANHNAAFRQARGKLFAIVNPDVRLPRFDLATLQACLDAPDVAACAPRVVDSAGRLQDSARRFPTVMRLLRRVLLDDRRPDYPTDAGAVTVDWVAGMFVLFRREAYAQVGGFDDRRFFMYYEDVDICRRLRRLGWRVVLEPAAEVVHDAQRASHRSLRHLRWHLTSAFRYLTGL